MCRLRILGLVLFLAGTLFAASGLEAQTQTLVTGTVAGSDGVPWAGAKMTVTLNTPGGQSPSITPCNNPAAGCQIQNPLPPTTLGTAGQIQGLNLWPNANILPASTSYTFTVSISPGVPPPGGTGPQSCTLTNQTISGAAQTLTFTGCPALTYAAPSGASSTTIDAVSCCGVVPDGKIFNDGSSSGTTISSASQATFLPTDVGKEILGWTTTCSTNNTNGQTDVFSVGTKIASYVSAHSVTVTSAPASSPTCVIYGTNNDTALSKVDAAEAASTQCPTIVLPVGMMIVDKPHFTNGSVREPNSCLQYPGYSGVSAGANYAARFMGQGAGTTVIQLGNAFAGNMASSCVNGTLTTSCFYVCFGCEWDDFTVQGGQETLSGNNPGSHAILEVGGYSRLLNMNFFNYAAQASGTAQIVSFAQSGAPFFVENTIFDGFGTGVSIGGGGVIGLNMSVEDYCNTPMINLQAGAVLKFNGGDNYMLPGGCTPANQQLLSVASGAPGGTVYGPGVLRFIGPNGAIQPWQGIILQGAGATVQLNNLQCAAGTGTSQTNTLCVNNNGGTVYAQNWQLTQSTTATKGYSNSAAGSQFFDECGNVFSGIQNLGGNFFGSCSINGTNVTAAKLVLSANWGTGAAVGTLSGSDAPIQFTITNGSASTGASPTITYTFPTPYWQAPLWCAATQVGGTNPSGTFAASSLSSTGVTFTFSLTPTASDTEIVQVVCPTQ
jgi:hypothetical protein